MQAFERTREFFSAGGAVLAGGRGNLLKLVAGIGLTAVVSVIPTHAEDASHQARSAAFVYDDAEIARLAEDGRRFADVLKQTYEATVSILDDQARRLASQVTVLRFGEFEVTHHMARELVRAAQDNDFPAPVLMAIAEKESSFDPEARPRKGTAVGLMQFVEQTWLEAVSLYGPEHGLEAEAAMIKSRPEGKRTHYWIDDPKEEERVLELRKDTYIAATLAIRNLKSARERIEAKLDRPMPDEDIYLPHLLGASGASALLAKSEERPNAIAAKTLPKAASFNASLFRKGGKPLTVRQFHERARDIIASRVPKYEKVEEVVAVLAPDLARDERPVVKIGYSR